MLRLLRKVHTVLYRGSVGLIFILLWPFLYAFSRHPGQYAAMNKVRRVYAFLSSGLLGLFYNIKLETAIDWNRPYVICANHSSNLDISAIILAARGSFRFMGKDELLNNFVTGFFFRTIDIPVNRESKISSFRAFKKAEESLRAGMSVVIFPEGRISDDYPPVLNDFKNGAFRLAIDNHVAILPVTLTNVWELMWDDGGLHGSKPGICDIFVHKPIETSELNAEDADRLKDEVRQIIASKLLIYAT
ncbi:MAG: 1-acyl-sn-glycerol-3-phosphate acyltransferase [Mucilaginibacter polytrichastri]|nr:1-acyl-sn-glycerol-3-phosphate acyltransferase [Mucilaginibacter polytrichastri]